MKSNRFIFFLAIAVILLTINLFITGSTLLTYALADGVPLGTFITWAGLIAVPTAIYYGIEELRNPSVKVIKYLSWILKLIYFLSILWVPISYLLAGNISFNFRESPTFQGGQTAMQVFWVFTYGLVISSILVLLTSLIISKIATRKNS